jgi:hypothetical protein
MDRDMRLKPGDRLSPPARRDQLDRVVLDRRCVQLGEPDHLRAGPAFGRKFVERRPGPYGHRPFERLDTVITRTNRRKRPGEQRGVNRNRKPVAALRPSDRAVTGGPADARDRGPQGARRNSQYVADPIRAKGPGRLGSQ